MAASLLRMGRYCSIKCIQVEGWRTSRISTVAALCTKAGGPKKPRNITSEKKSQSKTYFDIEKFVPHRNVEFPKKATAQVRAAAELAASPKLVEAVAAEQNRRRCS
ncbi:hypothetical protein UPYG_G00158580 [Umbra pygmaea]|uniref:Uncharacterized protein n=1 Tax=Umbra pygmaea TaxID=75934 RepID=A0ABD0XET9_UMBPY